MHLRLCLLFSSLALTSLLLLNPGQSQQPKQPGPKWAPSPHIAATDARTPEGERKGFHLPPGFEVQLVAAEPEIKRPINIAFDAKGRLWVTLSTEYPFAAK